MLVTLLENNRSVLLINIIEALIIDRSLLLFCHSTDFGCSVSLVLYVHLGGCSSVGSEKTPHNAIPVQKPIMVGGGVYCRKDINILRPDSES